MKVLLIEDDTAVGQWIVSVLKKHRYVVDLVSDGEWGLDLAMQETYDIILLDLMLPKLDGVSICRRLRQMGNATPILMLTAKTNSQDMVTGLDAGADDYIIKPCEPEPLLARMRAVVRRAKPDIAPLTLTWGDVCLNPQLIRVSYRDQAIPLSPREYSLIELFLRFPQRIFTRDAIIDSLWTIDDSPSTAAVTNLVKDLRRKLKQAGMQEDMIETVHRLGYRLKAASVTTPDEPASQELCREEASRSAWSTSMVSPTAQAEGLQLLEAAHQNFHNSLDQRLEQLEAALEQWQQAGAMPGELHPIGAIAHSLAGSLGIFGWPAETEIARQIEHLAEFPPLAPNVAEQLRKLVNDLKQGLARSHPFPLPTSPPATPDTLWLVGGQATLQRQLQTAATAQSLTLIPLDPVSPPSATAIETVGGTAPAALLFSLDQITHDLARLQQWRTAYPTTPLIVLARDNVLETRVAISKLGITACLATSTPAAQIIDFIQQRVTPAAAPDSKVLLLDDDPVALQAMTALLQQQGLQVIALEQPELFWEALQVHQPDLLLLDLAMPKFNGLDLCQVVRQDPEFCHLPILVVTAHTDHYSLHQAFAAGVDDLIAKEAIGQELVGRVLNCLARHHRGRSQRHPMPKSGVADPASSETMVNVINFTGPPPKFRRVYSRQP